MFLKTLYHKWRTMFFIVIAFIFLQAFFMYKAVETTPFFLSFMYSTKISGADTSFKTTIYVNNKKFTKQLTNREGEILMGSFSYFNQLKQNHFFATDSSSIAQRFKNKLPQNIYNMVYKRLTNTSVTDSIYFNWFKKYLSQLTGETIDSFSIVTSSVAWQPSYHELNDTFSLVKYVFNK